MTHEQNKQTNKQTQMLIVEALSLVLDVVLLFAVQLFEAQRGKIIHYHKIQRSVKSRYTGKRLSCRTSSLHFKLLQQ